ncbi:hypothetical protein PJWF_00115 [Achromobacter phage JWF]|uniref:hypothetical protein n=1 Tax=Achromobacter phage JWF TaxID=1589748 RepID=UPI000588DFF1|nr:hypothetical protein AXJ13_gp073 [Achromobacter phage JWF]AJD83008.1 hypothetical protein PJWF_00115 [Achromobacter phage JWF]
MRQSFTVAINGKKEFDGHNGKQAKNVYNDLVRKVRRDADGFVGAVVILTQDGKIIRDSTKERV